MGVQHAEAWLDTPALVPLLVPQQDAKKWGGKPYSARYIGSLVGDFHRTLL